jgi:hypothetical protein
VLHGARCTPHDNPMVWQVDSPDYVVAWKVTEDEPREVERRMIVAFVAEYGRRPFANLKD